VTEAPAGLLQRLGTFLLPTLAGYRSEWLGRDLYASLILWTLLVPQALAYAQTAGMPPEYGLYAALGGMAGYALLGVSRQMNVGPEATVGLLSATAIAPIAAGNRELFITLSAALAVVTGVVCVGIGLLRLGFLARLLSRPVLVGYLAGTGVTMILSQADKLLGVDVESYDAITEVGAILQALGDANLTTLAIGVAVVGGIVVLRRVAPAVPAFLVAIAVATAVAALLQLDTRNGVAVVGDIPTGLPGIAIPAVNLDTIGELVLPGLGIAFLIFADSGITARALARRSREPVDQDRHMIGMGVAQIGAGLVRGFAVNGSASRSFAIADAGGRSQLVGMAGIGLVALTLLVLAPLFRSMPLAALGGITIVVGAGLIDVGEFRRIGRYDRADLVLALATAAGVIWIGMLAGILLVVLLSLLDVARRSAAPNTTVLVRVPGTDSYRSVATAGGSEQEPGLAIYRFDAPLFFANVHVFVDDVLRLAREGQDRHTVLVNAAAITGIDSTAAQALDELLDELDAQGVRLALARVSRRVGEQLEMAGLMARIGRDHVFLEVDDGVEALSSRASEARPPAGVVVDEA
jgi:SulP family sulfate permease